MAKKRIRNGKVRERECLACGKKGKERGATKIIKDLIKVIGLVVLRPVLLPRLFLVLAPSLLDSLPRHRELLQGTSLF